MLVLMLVIILLLMRMWMSSLLLLQMFRTVKNQSWYRDYLCKPCTRIVTMFNKYQILITVSLMFCSNVAQGNPYSTNK